MPSTCIFGSTARSRLDSYSDRDILVVAPSKRELHSESFRLSSEGWSVAAFTQTKIAEMAERGSLFLQHLKQEAIIVEDEGGFLASLMAKYRPKRDYEEELRDSLKLLQDVSHPNQNYWSTLCSADIAYIAIRNIAISRLAAEEIYMFDYNDLLDYFGGRCSISVAKLDALRALRVLKHSYRGRLTPEFPRDNFRLALEGAEELFGFSFLPPQVDRTEASGYRALRLLELQLVQRVDPRYLDKMPADDPLAIAWALIRDPRGYPDKPELRGNGWMLQVRETVERRFGTP
jgi:hypothetical protein